MIYTRERSAEITSRQRITLWLGIGIFAVIGLFPPWLADDQKLGHGFLFHPPAEVYTEEDVEAWRPKLTLDLNKLLSNKKPEAGQIKRKATAIDYTILGYEWFLVIAVTAALHYSFREAPEGKEKV